MSKEEAIEILSDMRCECNLFGDEEEATRYHALSWAINAMNTEPKHGQWLETEKWAKLTAYKCSECGRVVWDDTGYDVSKDYPYCHCGARMDGVEE